MTTMVFLAFADGRKEFIDDTHVHGFRDGHLLIATGRGHLPPRRSVGALHPVSSAPSPRLGTPDIDLDQALTVPVE